MTDLDTVIKGLSNCVSTIGEGCPVDCPYFFQCFSDSERSIPFMPLMQDALSLLKEQENEYEHGFNDAMLGKQELMYEGTDGKWHKKDW